MRLFGYELHIDKIKPTLHERLDETLYKTRAKQAAAYSKAAEYSVLAAAQLILSAKKIRKDLNKD